MTFNLEAKSMDTFKRIGYYWMSKISKVYATVEHISLAFPSFLYGGSWVLPCALFTKQTEKHFEYVDLQLKLPNLQPNIHDFISAHTNPSFPLKKINAPDPSFSLKKKINTPDPSFPLQK